MVEKRKAMHRDIIARYGDAPGFLRQTIPYNSEVEKMGVYRAPLTAVKPNSIAAKAYKGLFEELMGEKGL